MPSISFNFRFFLYAILICLVYLDTTKIALGCASYILEIVLELDF